MRELTQIDSSAEHGCSAPEVERWNVLEPVSGQWSWLVVYVCCGRVAVDREAGAEDLQQAA
ncbi:MAG TPA: hypothetical protein VK898_02035 [Chloroflexota bacterium]|nr:hypothetical protein [Chloroflexota bacterium]